jgi:putative SOS response-associated peptidase YedK
MCGRFALFDPGEALAEIFGLAEARLPGPRYNIAPSQPVAAVRLAPGGAGRELVMLRWGLVPPWGEDPAIGNRMINARAETVSEKPAFRAAFRSRRCLVPASGFYEWKSLAGRKQPYYVRMRDGRPFAMGGLWERWQGASGPALETCLLITTGANDLLAPIHDRMPVIVPPDAYDLWLSGAPGNAGRLLALLRPAPPERMEAREVGARVNDPGNDSPELIESDG